MKKFGLSLISLTLLLNIFAQKADTELPVFTEVANRLNAFYPAAFNALLANPSNKKAINKAIDSLQYTIAQCEKGMKEQLDPAFKQQYYLVANKHAIYLKYTTLSYLGQLASQPFFKDKKKIFDWLYSKYSTEKEDLEYSSGPYGFAWTSESQTAIGNYNYQMLRLAYAMNNMRNQVAFAQELYAVRDSHSKLQRHLIAIITMDGYLKNNMLADIKKEWYKIEMRPKELTDSAKEVVMQAMDAMLLNNKKLTDIDKTGELTAKFALLMFNYKRYDKAYEMFTEAANAGYNTNSNRIDALNCAVRVPKPDNVVLKKLADNLVMPIRECLLAMPAGWQWPILTT